ncbi:MAG: hypothetical protein FRX48_01674 [Lasallia pustulata]|uniref:Uncharacterized protein n=1 Tax=Lasallia pustulata TaxID=136370 RepID=A0A5M8PYW5_9LECA|nr:MAG: hypothetical protein FRX48_01674 [Lasallia pustulata]
MVGLLHFELFLLLRVQDLALALEEKTFPQSAVNFLEDRASDLDGFSTLIYARNASRIKEELSAAIVFISPLQLANILDWTSEDLLR